MGQIAQVAQKVFPEVVVQLCLAHYSRSFERTFRANSYKRSLKALERKLIYLEKSFFYITHHHDRKKAEKIINKIADLEFKYGYLIKIQQIFYDIFWKAKTLEEVHQLEDQLNIILGSIDLPSYPYRKRIIDRYRDYYKKRDKLLAWLFHPELNLPSTTNLIEGFNSTALEIRFSSIRGFEKEESARHYINALILKRRFQKFKDCKKKFKFLNGKSPLEIAQPLKNSIQLPTHQWIQLCRKLKNFPKNLVDYLPKPK